MADLIHRWTVWESEEGDHLQVSLAVLNSAWEPLLEFTKAVGPFFPLDEACWLLQAEVRDWLRLSGHQLELGL